MNGLRLVIVAAAMTVSACASDDGLGQAAKPEPAGQGQTVDVEIVVGSKTDLDKACAGNPEPTTVFVVSQKEVYHCIASKLHHHDEHGKVAGMDASIVRVSAGDRIRWFSKTNLFTVTSIEKQIAAFGPQDKTAPERPFGDAFAAKPASEVMSTPVPDLPGKVEQRYKVTFNIQGIGPVDPDVVCSF
jgi:plastocyanin